MSDIKRTKEEKRKSWDYAVGMSKVDGGEPSPEALALIERNINGEITLDEAINELITLYQE